MANKLYEFAFKIAGDVDSSLQNSLDSVSDQMGDAQQHIKQMNQYMDQLESGYKAGSISADSYAENHKKITEALKKEKTQQEALGIAMRDSVFQNAGSKLKNSMGRSFKSVDEAMEETERNIKQMDAYLDKLEHAYKTGGVSAELYARQHDEVSAALKKEKAQHEAVGKVAAGSGGSSLMGGASAMAGALGVGIGVGAIVVDIDSYQKALARMQGATGATDAEMIGFKQSLMAVYNSGLGENMDDVARAMATVKQVTGQTGTELEGAAQNALLLRDTFDMEVNESVRTANTMMKAFGINSEQAYSLMAQAAQKGADKNGDLLDTFNEYSVHFKSMGFSADQFTSVLIDGATNGAWSIDKVGDAIKEFNIRAKDGSKSSADGFAALGLNAADMTAEFAKGGPEAQKAFQAVITALEKMDDPVARNAAGVALFGTQFEDLEAQGVLAFAHISNSADMNAKTMEEIANNRLKNFGAAFSKVGRQLETGVIAPLAEKATPVLLEFADMIEQYMPKIQEAIGSAFEVIENIGVDNIIAAVSGIGAAFTALKVIGTVQDFMTLYKTMGLFSTLGSIFPSIGAGIAFLTSPVGMVVLAIGALVAAGVWAYNNWEIVQEFFVGLWESPAAMVLMFLTGPIGLLVAAVTGIIANWDVLKEWFTLLWENPSAAIDQFCGFFSSKLGELCDWAIKKWEGAREVLSHPIDSAVRFIKGEGQGESVASNARGGIYRKGEFLTTFAEEGPEAAIPLDGSTRAFNLWQI